MSTNKSTKKGAKQTSKPRTKTSAKPSAKPKVKKAAAASKPKSVRAPKRALAKVAKALVPSASEFMAYALSLIHI